MTTKISAPNITATGVTAGSYVKANITVNEAGQITSASDGGTLGGGLDYTTYTYTANGTSTSYQASVGISVHTVLVVIDGITQTPTTDYVTSGRNVVFVSPPPANSKIQIRVLGDVTSTGGGGAGITEIYDVASNSTGYFALPSGSTGERPASPTNGMVRYNTTIGAVEFYTPVGWVPYGALSVATVGPTTFNGNSGTVFTINGSGFLPGSIVRFITNDGTSYVAGTIAVNSSSTITATTPQTFLSTSGPLSVRVETPGGLQATLSNCISTGATPTWTTNAGSIATIGDVARLDYSTLQVSATDPEASITYSLISGAVPAGLSFNSNGSITGSPTAVTSNTTSNFTIRATDGVNTNDRTFSITINAPVRTILDYTGSLQTYAVPAGVSKLRVGMWGAGGGGGTPGGWSYGAPGGGGGYATGIVSVTPSTNVYVVVGGNGAPNSTVSAYGGGGPIQGGSDNRYGASGGGYSGLFSATTLNQANAIMIAGGGGGGGSSRAGTGNVGGAGGGLQGENGGSPYDGKTDYRGQGGTQTAAGGVINNSSSGQGPLQGGTSTAGGAYGGAGGGGWYGGSAGGYSEANTMSGGGGGSGYLHPTLVSSGNLQAGAGTVPGNSTGQFRINYGNGADPSGSGQPGRVIIEY
jgi:Glycine rich protein